MKFLVPFKEHVKNLLASGVFNGFAGLDGLTELVCLNLGDYSPDPVFDLSSLGKLEICKMGWSKKISGEKFFSLPKLREVSLFNYKNDDLLEIGATKNLVKLSLRYGSVKQFIGLCNCDKLEVINIINVRNIESINGIECCRSLKTVDFCNLNVACDISAIFYNCSELINVSVGGSAFFNDLDWIKSNKKVAKIRSDSVVRKIDWEVIFGAPELNEIAFKFVPGNIKTDIEIRAISRANGKNLKWIEHGGTKKSPWIELHFI